MRQVCRKIKHMYNILLFSLSFSVQNKHNILCIYKNPQIQCQCGMSRTKYVLIACSNEFEEKSAMVRNLSQGTYSPTLNNRPAKSNQQNIHTNIIVKEEWFIVFQFTSPSPF